MISRAERRWALIFAAVVMAATTVPYLIAAGAQRDGWQFGGFLIGVEDGNVYLAKMRQGAMGQFLNTLSHTTEPQTPALIYPVLHGLGWLAGPEPWAEIAAYHVARVAAGLLLLWVSYLFAARFIEAVAARRLALLLVALGGGLGWFLAIASPEALYGSLPVDFILPEALSFLMLFGLMHLALGRALLLLALLAYLSRRGLWAGLALLGVGLAQPLYIVVGWAVMGAHAAQGWWLDRRGDEAAAMRHDWRTALVAVAVSAPMVIYNAVVLGLDPALAQWMAQNVLPSPHPVHYALAYGVLLVPAVLGWRALWRRDARLALFAGGWVALGLALAYAPIPTQRRLVEGVQLPLVVLAVLGLHSLAAWPRRLAVGLVLALTLPTTVLLYLGSLGAARNVAEPAFHPPDQLAAFAWLRQNAKLGDAGLAAFETGNVLPAYAPLNAYIGHGPETLFLQGKLPRVAAFYNANTSDDERRVLLAEAGIDFVLFGPREAALGGYDPRGAPYLAWRFEVGRYAIYAVSP